MYSKTVALAVVSFLTVALLFGSYSQADVFAKKHGSSSSSSSSSNDNSGGGGSSSNSGSGSGGSSSSSSDNSGSGGNSGSSSGDNSGGGGGSGSGSSSSSNAPPSSSSSSTSQTACPDGSQPDANGKCPPAVPPSNTQKTACPDGFKLNDTNGKCIPKNSSTSRTTTTTTTNTQTGNAASNTGTTAMTTPSSTPMQTGNNGGNTTTTTQKKTAANTTTGVGAPQMQTANTASNAATNCTGLSSFDPTTGSCTSKNPSSTQSGFDLQVPTSDGTCPAGYHMFPGSTNVCARDAGTSTPTTQTGGAGTTTNTSSTTSTPKQLVVPPLQSGSCPYGSSPHPTLGSFSNAGQPGTGSVLCLSTQNAVTAPSAPTGFHIDANGSLTENSDPDGSCPVGSEHYSNKCFVLAILADNNGNCRWVGFTHVQGTNPTFCFESSALEGENGGTTTNSGTGSGTTSTLMNMPMKTGTNTASTTQTKTQNTGSNKGTECTGLSSFDPTTGSCTSGSPSTTPMQTGNTGSNTGTTTQMQTGNNGGNTGTECKGLSQFDPTTGTCLSENGGSTGTTTNAGTANTGATTTSPTRTLNPTPDSISQQGNCGPGGHIFHGNDCASDAFPYDDGTCPPGRIHLPGPDQYYCSIPPVLPGSTTGTGGGFIQMIPSTSNSKPTGGGSTGTTNTGTGGTPTTTNTPMTPSDTAIPPNSDGSCPTGYHIHPNPDKHLYECAKVTSSTTKSIPTTQTGGASTSNPAQHPVHMEVDSPANVDGTCPAGSQKIDVAGGRCLTDIQSPDGLCPSGTTATPSATTAGTVPGECTSDHPFTPSQPSPPAQTGNIGSSTGSATNTGGTTPMTTPMKTGGGTTTTGTGTASPAGGTGTSTSTSTTTTTTKVNNNIVRGGHSASSSVGGSTQAPTTTPSVTYVNIPDKITIRYPPTWTKTEFANNPSIPVIFNAPINGTTATAVPTKTTLMININQLPPSSATPDAYAQQQISALTNSSVIKYTISDTNSKVLTPPAGIAAYREISYNGIKNSTVNNISTQIPLKGTAIFFVNGNTGYSLLYLAKQSEYNQNLPTVQQMINTFQMNATTSGEPTGGGNIK